MDATAHLVAGAAAGARLRPYWAILAGVLTHALIDAIPHTNYTGWRPFSWVLAADILLGSVLTAILVFRSGNALGCLAGSLGGILPAVERALSGQFEDFLARPPLSLPDVEIAPPIGILTQVLVIAVALAFSLGRSARSRHSLQ